MIKGERKNDTNPNHWFVVCTGWNDFSSLAVCFISTFNTTVISKQLTDE
jgi:hypothetical protein